MRLIIKYNPHETTYYQIIPVTWSSKIDLLMDFKREAERAKTKDNLNFRCASREWYTWDFFNSKTNFEYCGPDVYTVDEFFEDVEPYTSDGMS